jgi:Asp-tRNA(Asn)/Glu-tRNA(Gln) amidotransferase A subunit family amidase
MFWLEVGIRCCLPKYTQTIRACFVLGEDVDMRPPHELSIAELARAVGRGDLESTAPIDAALERIDALDPMLNSFIELRASASIEAREAGGPLRGVPIAVKDVFVDGGRAPTAGSRVRPTWLTGTALALSRLRDAGAVIVGYTNMHEWSLDMTSTVSAFGPVHNPWDRSRVAGGSSGGSAAAVSAALVPGAIGTDAGGSIRCPAACCGTVGFKPTWGVVPTDGYTGDGGPYDHVGPMARSVEDVKLLLSVLAGRSFGDADLGGARVAVARTPFFDDAAEDVCAIVEGAVAAFAQRTGAVQAVTMRGLEDAVRGVSDLLALTAARMGETLQTRGGDLQPSTRRMLRWGAAAGANELAALAAARRRVRRRWDAALADADLVLTPTLPATPPPIAKPDVELPAGAVSASTAYLRWNAPMNVVGVPSLSLPCGMTPNGMPVGITISGRRGEDELVLAAGVALEDALDRRYVNQIAPVD